jgi:hypothetical protein
MTCTHKKLFSGNKIKEDEMGRACETHAGGEKYVLGFGREN